MSISEEVKAASISAAASRSGADLMQYDAVEDIAAIGEIGAIKRATASACLPWLCRQRDEAVGVGGIAGQCA